MLRPSRGTSIVLLRRLICFVSELKRSPRKKRQKTLDARFPAGERRFSQHLQYEYKSSRGGDRRARTERYCSQHPREGTEWTIGVCARNVHSGDSRTPEQILEGLVEVRPRDQEAGAPQREVVLLLLILRVGKQMHELTLVGKASK